jgi:spore coat protein U-like protein
MKTRMGRLAAGAGAAALIAGVAGLAQPEAATAQSDLPVTAAVIANCTITAGSVDFGDYDPIGTHATNPLSTTGTVAVRCTRGTSAFVGLDGGQHNSAGRRMNDGGLNYLSYELFLDSPGGTVWGATDPARYNYVAANSAPQDLTVFGQIPAGQDAFVGDYSDLVVAEIEF